MPSQNTDIAPIVAESRDGSSFIDTPLLKAKRVAFDNPTIQNLDALISEAKREV